MYYVMLGFCVGLCDCNTQTHKHTHTQLRWDAARGESRSGRASFPGAGMGAFRECFLICHSWVTFTFLWVVKPNKEYMYIFDPIPTMNEC